MTMPTLDETVLKSLDFFSRQPPPKLDLSGYSLPFVIGSGNAYNTGRLLFSGKAAVFADESNFKSVAQAYTPIIRRGLIHDAIVISASGEKDSVWELNLAKTLGLNTTLLTCKPQSSAAQISDRTVIYKSIAEPYTYNTSTYLGMILSTTGEHADTIRQMISRIAIPSGFDGYTSYAFVLPDAFLNVTPMIVIKDDELFGPHLAIRAFTEGHARHAKFVHPWEKELVIAINTDCTYFGHPDHRWLINLPENAGFGTVLSLTYYVCGRIQKAKPDYFMRNIKNYCSDYGPKAYGKKQSFDVIVPANS